MYMLFLGFMKELRCYLYYFSLILLYVVKVFEVVVIKSTLVLYLVNSNVTFPRKLHCLVKSLRNSTLQTVLQPNTMQAFVRRWFTLISDQNIGSCLLDPMVFRVGTQTLQASVGKVIDCVAMLLQRSPTPLAALHLCDEIIGPTPHVRPPAYLPTS
jgi:hypothetical protein